MGDVRWKDVSKVMSCVKFLLMLEELRKKKVKEAERYTDIDDEFLMFIVDRYCLASICDDGKIRI